MNRESGRLCWSFKPERSGQERKDRMKKAVFIINSLQLGGAERVVVTQAEFLQKSGIDVTIICFRKRHQYDICPGVKIISLTEKNTLGPVSCLTGLVWLKRRLNNELDKIAKSGEIILLTSNLLYPNIITRLSKYSKQSLYVLHAHQDILPFATNPLYKLFIHLLYKRRRIICVGDSVAKEMRNVYHVDKKMIEAVVNPINMDIIDELKKVPLNYDKPYILFCGRLTSVKCPERMIEAYYHGRFYDTYNLVILGIGELEDKLRHIVQSYGISDKVDFRGMEKNVYKWMYNAKLLVLTSNTEGLSMTLIEALYCECPVVAVNSRGPVQILRGELKRFLCEPSAESVALKMKEALTDYPCNLTAYTDEYSVERNLEKYLKIYRKWNESIR